MFGVSAAVVLYGLANGGNFALVALELGRSGASDTVVGLATSAYFIGALAASIIGVAIVGRLGHRRAFVLSAILAGGSTLCLAAIQDSTIWPFARTVTGFAMGLYYLVIESWFHHAITNHGRGRLIAAYETLRIVSVSFGSFVLIALYGAIGLPVFIIAGALYITAITPVLRNRLTAPPPNTAFRPSLRPLLPKALLGLLCCLVGGLTTGSIYGLLPLYAQQTGQTTVMISALVFATHFGSVFIQMPSGIFTDRVGRNAAIALVSTIGMVAAMIVAVNTNLPWFALLGASAIMGGACHTIFALGTIYANDHLNEATFVSGAAALNITYDIGTILGPVGVALLMQSLGPEGFYYGQAALMGSVVAVGGVVLYQRGPGRPR